MNPTSSGDKVRSRFRAGCLKLCFLILTVAVVSFGSLKAHALWLPWATDKDKIEKRLGEIWAALIARDRQLLKRIIVGDGVEQFIDHELDQIQTLKIKKYESKVNSVQIDRASGSFAFVDFERTGTTEDGKKIVSRFFKAFKKVGEDWKLMTGAERKKTKTPADSAEADQAFIEKLRRGRSGQ